MMLLIQLLHMGLFSTCSMNLYADQGFPEECKNVFGTIVMSLNNQITSAVGKAW